jgi:hypothetical protein
MQFQLTRLPDTSESKSSPLFAVSNSASHSPFFPFDQSKKGGSYKLQCERCFSEMQFFIFIEKLNLISHIIYVFKFNF